MLEQFDQEIKKVRERFKLSLAQFGSLVGAPAITVKRWEQGVKPQERFVFQTVLVLGLINDPDEVFFDLGRQGIVLDKKTLGGICRSYQSGTQKSLVTAEETNLPEPDVDGALVAGDFRSSQPHRHSLCRQKHAWRKGIRLFCNPYCPIFKIDAG